MDFISRTFFSLATISYSDAIFVFPEVDLHIRMLISSQNSDFQISSMYCEALKEIRSLKMASS